MSQSTEQPGRASAAPAFIAFTVYGTPIPKGSTRAFMPKGARFPIVTADNAKTKPWQEAIVAAAVEARNGGTPIAEPVTLYAIFYLPRPKSAPRRVVYPAKKPDLDKLVRTLKDGLTRAGIYHDDGQVITVHAHKCFAGGQGDTQDNGPPRMWVRVEPSTDGGS